jgi:hypothetical protein
MLELSRWSDAVSFSCDARIMDISVGSPLPSAKARRSSTVRMARPQRERKAVGFGAIARRRGDLREQRKVGVDRHVVAEGHSIGLSEGGRR